MNSRKISKTKAMEILRKRLIKITHLTKQSADSLEFRSWHKETAYVIGQVFSPSTNERQEFKRIDFEVVDIFFEEDVKEQRKAFLNGLKEAEYMLNSFVERIDDFWSQNPIPPALKIERETERSLDSVFIVHGHDKEAKETVARFLQRHQLRVVILHEKANKGRTIIEKIEQNDDVGFAVILLTPDDIGASSAQSSNLRPRARQNVIFEFGYFISKLGRANVCALVVGDIEKPSDYDGVLYIRMDGTDGWKLDLMREMKNAGIDIDANKELDT